MTGHGRRTADQGRHIYQPARRFLRRAAGWLALLALLLTQPAMLAGMTMAEAGPAVARAAGLPDGLFDPASICHVPDASGDPAAPAHDGAGSHHCALCTAVTPAPSPWVPRPGEAHVRAPRPARPACRHRPARRRRRRPRAPPAP
ncbi:DUF2946 family protein [Tistrella mobilis]|uniref:DUF2946 family protein n=1 Tax=Tistrella mobilis TaxID=171437 RepID=UPI003558BAA2